MPMEFYRNWEADYSWEHALQHLESSGTKFVIMKLLYVGYVRGKKKNRDRNVEMKMNSKSAGLLS